MPRAIPDNEKSRGRGRPKTGAILIGVRIEPDLLAKVDRLASTEKISRPEAVRRLIAKA